MSIKLSDGSRVSIDLEDKETIARIVSTRKAEEEKAKLKQEVTPQVPKEEPRKEVSSLTIKGFLVSIPFSILGFLEFYAIDILTTLLLSLLFLGLSYIPIISTLIDWLFYIRKDTPDMLAMMVSAILAYLGTTATAKHIVKGTRKHALILTGIYLVVLNIIFLIVNLINGAAILPNIIIGIAGIVMFYKNKD